MADNFAKMAVKNGGQLPKMADKMADTLKNGGQCLSVYVIRIYALKFFTVQKKWRTRVLSNCA